jgi:hypothetical protein
LELLLELEGRTAPSAAVTERSLPLPSARYRRRSYRDQAALVAIKARAAVNLLIKAVPGEIDADEEAD